MRLPARFAAIVAVALSALPALADGPATQPDDPTAMTPREQDLADRLTGATLEGRFTVAGGEDIRIGGADRYEIRNVTKVAGDQWLIVGRVQYGQKNIVAPVPMRLTWSGQAAVFSLPQTKLPGLGTYGAQWMIDGDHYAGTWAGGEKRGHFFGAIRRSVEQFDRVGVIVSPHAFFDAAADARTRQEDLAPARGEVTDRALATADAVYAFLETPANEKLLAGVGVGDTVRVKGQQLRSGRLLHATAIEKTDAKVDTSAQSADAGKPVTLSGTNKCQCGLKVETLPKTCKLGHLHHLEAGDGNIYHYLQFDDGKNLLTGRGFHFKKVTVKGTLLAGRYILVESVEK